MQPAGASAGASLKWQRESLAIADAEKRRFKVDSDILECPIFSEPFAPPVYQCENGHTACASCCKKFTIECPSCTQPIGRVRCLAVEKMIESLEIDCKNAHFGCKSMVKLSQREEHENDLCEHRPIQCPIPGHQEHGISKSQMAIHLFTHHRAKIMNFCEDTRSVSFKVELSKEYVVLKWLLLHCLTEKRLGARMYCIAFGRSKIVPNTWSRDHEVA